MTLDQIEAELAVMKPNDRVDARIITLILELLPHLKACQACCHLHDRATGRAIPQSEPI